MTVTQSYRRTVTPQARPALTAACCQEEPPTTREETIKQLIKQQLRKAAPKMKGYRVLLFGSRVTGKARDRSDFDVGIVGARPVPLQTFYEIDDLLESIETPGPCTERPRRDSRTTTCLSLSWLQTKSACSSSTSTLWFRGSAST